MSVSRRALLLLTTGFWTAIAFLYAVQATSRGHDPFTRNLATSLASFVPCILLTPAIALLATRWRFAPGARGRSAASHAAGMLAFLIVAGAMMGASEWLLPWDREGTVTNAAAAAITRYLPFDVLTYVLVAAAAIALAYAREAFETRAASQRCSIEGASGAIG